MIIFAGCGLYAVGILGIALDRAVEMGPA